MRNHLLHKYNTKQIKLECQRKKRHEVITRQIITASALVVGMQSTRNIQWTQPFRNRTNDSLCEQMCIHTHLHICEYVKEWPSISLFPFQWHFVTAPT